MLTIKAPLELTCRPSIVPSHEAFYHRIMGNYGVIGSGIDQEDLLHVMTMPPEIYLGEGGMTHVVQQMQIQNSQENKLTIINNLLNRIAIMEEAHLTYQDRVYITDILTKLGIKDVQQFMKQVSYLKQETQTTEHLISLYWNHLEELTKMVQNYQEKREKSKTETQTVQKDSYYLHEEINYRLKTGAIYQILHNFYSSHHYSNVSFTQAELQIAEQKQVAVQMLLHELKNEIQGKQLPLSYLHENYYEMTEPREEEHVEEAVSRQITSAVLLNLVDRLYISHFEKQQYQLNTWLSMEHALYRIAENTLYRLQTSYASQIHRQKESNLYMQIQQKMQMQEITAVQQLLMAGWESEERFSAIQERYGTEIFKIWNHDKEQADLYYRTEESQIQTIEIPGAYQDIKIETDSPKDRKGSATYDVNPSIESEKNKSSDDEQKSISKRIQEQAEVFGQVIEQTSASGQMQPAGQPRSAKESPVQIEMQHTFTGGDQIYDTTAEAYLLWVEEGEKYFEQMMEQYLTTIQTTQQDLLQMRSPKPPRVLEETEVPYASLEIPPLPETKEAKAAQAARTIFLKWQEQEEQAIAPEEKRAADRQEGQEPKAELLSPQFLYEMQQLKQGSWTEQQQHLIEQQTNVLSVQDIHRDRDEQEEETKSHFEHPRAEEETLRQQLLQINQQNIANYNAYQQLLKEQQRAQKKRPAVARDMKKDSLRALKDPEGLIREYQKEQAEAELLKQSKTEQMIQLLPEQTRRLYQRLEQYLSSPGSLGEEGSTLKDDTARLVYDIRQAEARQSPLQQTEIENVKEMQKTSHEVLEKWQESASKEVLEPPDPGRTLSHPPISMVHRSTESQISEELLQYLTQQNQIGKKTTEITREETQDHQVIKTAVHQQTHQILEKETEDLTELIQQGVRRQIGALSDQIYNKLEKRLQNEKKRRGY